MSRDVRELILQRITELLVVRGISSSARNAGGFSDGAALPGVILFDGDEMARDLPTGRGGRSPYAVTMHPIIQITAQGDDSAIGSTLNDLRLRIMAAVLQDAELAGLSADGVGVRYQETLTRFTPGRAMQGDMVIRFSILYYVIPSDF